MPTNPQSQLDRLVDGELTEADRRELLLQLEHEPEGWRRCALAFLEAQCWEQELTLVARAPERSGAETAPTSARNRGNRPPRRVRLTTGVLAAARGHGVDDGGLLPHRLGLGHGTSRMAGG